MKTFVWVIFCGTCFFVGRMIAVPDGVTGEPVRVLYSLDAKQNDQEIVQLIDGAERYAYFAIYTFTLPDVAQALARAKRRGVDVRGLVDRQQASLRSEQEILEILRSARIPVEMQKHVAGIMHMKLLVTDKAYAVGSYNWTRAATEVNDEVLEIGGDGAARQDYLAIVQKVLSANR